MVARLSFPELECIWFGAQGVGWRVEAALGHRVRGLGGGVWSLGFRVWG